MPEDRLVARDEVAVVLVGGDHVEEDVDDEEDVDEQVEHVERVLRLADVERQPVRQEDRNPADEHARGQVPIGSEGALRVDDDTLLADALEPSAPVAWRRRAAAAAHGRVAVLAEDLLARVLGHELFALLDLLLLLLLVDLLLPLLLTLPSRGGALVVVACAGGRRAHIDPHAGIPRPRSTLESILILQLAHGDRRVQHWLRAAATGRAVPSKALRTTGLTECSEQASLHGRELDLEGCVDVALQLMHNWVGASVRSCSCRGCDPGRGALQHFGSASRYPLSTAPRGAAVGCACSVHRTRPARCR